MNVNIHKQLKKELAAGAYEARLLIDNGYVNMSESVKTTFHKIEYANEMNSIRIFKNDDEPKQEILGDTLFFIYIPTAEFLNIHGNLLDICFDANDEEESIGKIRYQLLLKKHSS